MKDWVISTVGSTPPGTAIVEILPAERPMIEPDVTASLFDCGDDTLVLWIGTRDTPGECIEIPKCLAPKIAELFGRVTE